jgi:hypothetical protein
MNTDQSSISALRSDNQGAIRTISDHFADNWPLYAREETSDG